MIFCTSELHITVGQRGEEKPGSGDNVFYLPGSEEQTLPDLPGWPNGIWYSELHIILRRFLSFIEQKYVENSIFIDI